MGDTQIDCTVNSVLRYGLIELVFNSCTRMKKAIMRATYAWAGAAGAAGAGGNCAGDSRLLITTGSEKPTNGARWTTPAFDAS